MRLYTDKKLWTGYVRVKFIKLQNCPVFKCANPKCTCGFLKTRGEDQIYCIPCMKVLGPKKLDNRNLSPYARIVSSVLSATVGR